MAGLDWLLEEEKGNKIGASQSGEKAVMKGMKKANMCVPELAAKRYFGRQTHSGFKSKLDNPMGKKNLITWGLVQPMILGMQILVIAKFLVAGVKVLRQYCSHLPCSCACSLGIYAKPFRNSILCQSNL